MDNKPEKFLALLILVDPLTKSTTVEFFYQFHLSKKLFDCLICLLTTVVNNKRVKAHITFDAG